MNGTELMSWRQICPTRKKKSYFSAVLVNQPNGAEKAVSDRSVQREQGLRERTSTKPSRTASCWCYRGGGGAAP